MWFSLSAVSFFNLVTLVAGRIFCDISVIHLDKKISCQFCNRYFQLYLLLILVCTSFEHWHLLDLFASQFYSQKPQIIFFSVHEVEFSITHKEHKWLIIILDFCPWMAILVPEFKLHHYVILNLHVLREGSLPNIVYF